MGKYKVKQDVILRVGSRSLPCKAGDVVELTSGQAHDVRAYVEAVVKHSPKPKSKAKKKGAEE